MRMSSVLPAVLSLAWFIRRTPGKRDYLENFHPGSRRHNTGMPANRAGSVVLTCVARTFEGDQLGLTTNNLFLTHWWFNHFQLLAFTILSLVK